MTIPSLVSNANSSRFSIDSFIHLSSCECQGSANPIKIFQVQFTKIFDFNIAPKWFDQGGGIFAQFGVFDWSFVYRLSSGFVTESRWQFEANGVTPEFTRPLISLNVQKGTLLQLFNIFASGH